jgi:hypothetical protein
MKKIKNEKFHTLQNGKIYKIEVKNSQNHIIDQNSRIKKVQNQKNAK